MGAADNAAATTPNSEASKNDHITLHLEAGPGPQQGAQPSALKRINTAATLVQQVDKSQQLAVEWVDLDAWVPTLFLAAPQPDAEKQPPKERQILFANTALVEPGEVMALMGPSGSGKSSLLTLLGGRSSARMSGSIKFGGRPLTKPIKRKLGYVAQDDLLFAELTVYETLYFAAMLRLPRHWSKEAKLQRVESVIQGLGLDKCRDTIIGSHMQRGVSGGERKRVSIGHELLINPSVVLLDEPTSGLDSTTALRLLHTLRTLATGGRTIITSIHQPSSRLYQQMDKLLLLSEGRTMYYGAASAAAAWFASQHAPCPFGVNIADHILDLANGQQLLPGAPALPSGQQQQASRAKGLQAQLPTAEELCDAFAKRTIGLGRHGVLVSEMAFLEGDAATTTSGSGPSTASGPLLLAAPPVAGGASAAVLAVDAGELDMQQGGHGASVAKPSASSTSTAVLDGEDDVEAEDEEQATAAAGKAKAKGDSRWGASWPQQVALLTVRSVRTRRFQSLSVQKILQNLAVAVLAGLFWWQIGQKDMTAQSARDIGGLLFFIQLYLCFSTMFAALFTFPLEFNMLQKERQSGMYRLSAYYLARTGADFPLDLAVPSAFFIILYWMTGLRIDAGAFFAMWWGTMLVVLVAQTCGLLIGATVPNPQNSQTIATIIMLTMMLVGGYYVRDIPVWISWLKYVSFIYWGYNVLLKVQFRHLSYPCSELPNFDGTQTEGGCDVADASVFPTDVDRNIALDVCILIAMLIVLRVLVYYSLQYRTTFRKGQRTTMIEALRRTMTRSRK